MRRPRKVEAMPAAATRMESLRLQLEEEILGRRIDPGQKLDEEEIAARFGVSRTPVREALKALASSGLIEIKPHQGASVAVLSPRTVIDMVETMSILEVSCAGMAAKRHTWDDQGRIIKAQEACESVGSRMDPGAFYRANITFHEAIYGASQNAFLAAQAQLLRLRLEPYRRQAAFHPGTIARSNEEHRRIVVAILALDEAEAREAMRQHLGNLQDTIASMFDEGSTPRRVAAIRSYRRGANEDKSTSAGRPIRDR